ncbi:hypothetical protein N665_0198s0129 [Sinapis alba]|nr:hypothetical protein N665_0198s0129 [Sinapis alba]
MWFPLFGLVSNGNLDDAASAYTWLLLSTFISFSNDESKDVFAVIQKLNHSRVELSKGSHIYFKRPNKMVIIIFCTHYI